MLGSEVKALRLGREDISGLMFQFLEAKLILSMKNLPYKFSRIENYQEDRAELLLQKKEIISLKSKLDQEKLTIVPLSLYLKKGNFKLEIALLKAKLSTTKGATSVGKSTRPRSGT